MNKVYSFVRIALIGGVLLLVGYFVGSTQAQNVTTINTIIFDWTPTSNNGNLAGITINGTRGGGTGNIVLNLVNKTCTAPASTTYCAGGTSSSLSNAQVSQLQSMFPASLKNQVASQIINVIQPDSVQ